MNANAIRVQVPYIEAATVGVAAAALREIADRIEQGGSWGSAAPNAPDGDPIRWHYDVKPIVESRPSCSRCGGNDNPRPLPKKHACEKCGDRPLCYACDVTHNAWCGR